MTLDVKHHHLIGARALPDGSYSFEESRPDLAQRLRDGDAEFGWLGDDRLTLVLNVKWREDDPQHRGLPRYEVWRLHEQGEPTLVCHQTALRVNADALIGRLAASDSRTRDIASDMLREREKRTERLKREHRDENEGRADKLAWALGRDVGAPAQDGRIFATGK